MTALAYNPFDQPAEIHGFTIEMGVDVFPPGEPGSGRHALYAWLSPATAENRQKMKRAGKANIRAHAEITAYAAKVIREDPQHPVAEQAAAKVLSHAARLAKIVQEA